jgi:hypothetical protein
VASPEKGRRLGEAALEQIGQAPLRLGAQA